ncbi:Putative glycoside hydrolase, family 27, glycosyl hydrolase, all-beta, aldolase-type TIM barrel [Septoria linicola]|uniref:Alpha-galactosidase n=1 Tax=Septoria linicola TaxID=215465 RepID=A0A9Q9ASE0_9PEZI|nr:Putative glycoside hydrolase, family 27, glycosyl hydrolase, all-beta, aldolase-type TIM barrel [Septoria linicola]
MGFNTYNVAACTINQTWVRDQINAVDSDGFRAAGYSQFGLDCGCVFPDGIKPLSSLAISKGFTWGMYTDQGIWACDFAGPARPGSLNYERQDALQLAGWNTNYLKVDNCYIDGQNNAPKNPRSDFPSRFGAMQNALREVGIKGMLVSQWGVPYTNNPGLYDPSAWTPPLATSYRVSDGVAQGWQNIIRIYNKNIHVCNNDLTGPGRFADMNLMEVGNPGMTTAEQATHSAVWAMMKSPLIMSTRILGMDPAIKSILQNRGLIAINQYPSGKPVKLTQRFSLDNDQFAGPLQNGDRAVLLVDQSNTRRNLGLEFGSIGISRATVTNLWTGEVINNVNRYFTTVDAHGSAPLRLSNIVTASTAAPQLRYYEAEAVTRGGQANVQSCQGCSGGQKVGNVGGNADNVLTFTGINTSAASQDVRFDYINCDIGNLGGNQYSNVRGASISVNDGPGQSVLFPISGCDWTKDVQRSFLVRLYGFRTNAANTIKISQLSSVTQFAPDFDRIGVVA